MASSASIICPHCGQPLPAFYTIQLLAGALPQKPQIAIADELPQILGLLAAGPLFTREVSMMVNISREAALRRLQTLERDGKVVLIGRKWQLK
jgi:hypothetical protein